MAELLRTRLTARGWPLVNDSPLAIVCFTHPSIEGGAPSAAEVVERVVGGGRAWISQVRLSGSGIALRACITSTARSLPMSMSRG